MFTFGLPPSLSLTLSIWPFWPQNCLCEAVLGSGKPGCYSCVPYLGVLRGSHLHSLPLSVHMCQVETTPMTLCVLFFFNIYLFV